MAWNDRYLDRMEGSELVGTSKDGQAVFLPVTSRKNRLYVELVIARRAQEHSPPPVKGLAFDLSRDLS